MSLEKLIEYFLKFPGIGPRQAKRFAYFLANENNEFLENLSKSILEIKKNIIQCNSCFRLFEESGAIKQCNICRDLNREKSIIMVIEKDVDLDNIEKTNAYNGMYFILGGVIPLTNAGKINNLRFKELFKKVETEKPAEIIIATSATTEGENTGRYIEKILEPIRQAQGVPKITRLGRGLSTGTELEYIDSSTMSDALKNRK